MVRPTGTQTFASVLDRMDAAADHNGSAEDGSPFTSWTRYGRTGVFLLVNFDKPVVAHLLSPLFWRRRLPGLPLWPPATQGSTSLSGAVLTRALHPSAKLDSHSFLWSNWRRRTGAIVVADVSPPHLTWSPDAFAEGEVLVDGPVAALAVARLGSREG